MNDSRQRHIQYPNNVFARISDWINKNYAVSVNGLLVLLLADVVVDPKNLIFHAKYVLFVLVLGVGLISRITRKEPLSRKLWFVVIFISFFMPFYALSVSIVNGALNNTHLGELIYFNSFFFFLIVLVIKDKEGGLARIFNGVSLLVVFITIALYLILLLDTRFFGDLYKYFVTDKGAAMYALRSYGKMLVLMIYYKTSPVLVFPLSYYLYQIFINNKKKSPFYHYLLFFIIAATLVLSGARANLFALVFIVLFYIGFSIYRKSKLWFVLVGSAFLLAFLFTFPTVFQVFLNPHEVSNATKFGYIPSYADFFNQHFLSLIFGQGIGGAFYTSALHRFTNVTELAYFELIRIWGIPVSALFAIILIWPLVMEIKTKTLSHLFIAYLAFLFIAGTNPLLLSSTGMLVLVYVFSMEFGKHKELETIVN